MSGRVMAFSVYAHCPCSGISALLNMGIRDMQVQLYSHKHVYITFSDSFSKAEVYSMYRAS